MLRLVSNRQAGKPIPWLGLKTMNAKYLYLFDAVIKYGHHVE